MKKICLLLSIVFALTSCNCQKKAVEGTASSEKMAADGQKLPRLEYEANTRGFFEKITIENRTVTVSADRNKPNEGTVTTLSDSDANTLSKLLKNLDLNALPTYKDPTQKRFYDGAAIANFKVIRDGKEYKTVDFDHQFPPAEIEALVNKIVSFGTKRE